MHSLAALVHDHGRFQFAADLVHRRTGRLRPAAALLQLLDLQQLLLLERTDRLVETLAGQQRCGRARRGVQADGGQGRPLSRTVRLRLGGGDGGDAGDGGDRGGRRDEFRFDQLAFVGGRRSGVLAGGRRLLGSRGGPFRFLDEALQKVRSLMRRLVGRGGRLGLCGLIDQFQALAVAQRFGRIEVGLFGAGRRLAAVAGDEAGVRGGRPFGVHFDRFHVSVHGGRMRERFAQRRIPQIGAVVGRSGRRSGGEVERESGERGGRRGRER